MSLLTISGIRQALEFIRDNGNIKYHNSGPLKGLFVKPESFTGEQGYSLFLVQKFTPKLTTLLSDGLTILTLDGQELLDILSDTLYLEKVSNDLKTIGYTSPSDRQIFREVRRRMEIVDFNPKEGIDAEDLFRKFFRAAHECATPSIQTHIGNTNVEVVEQVAPLELEEPKLVIEQPPVEENKEEEVVVENNGGIGSSLAKSNSAINIQGGRSSKNKSRN